MKRQSTVLRVTRALVLCAIASAVWAVYASGSVLYTSAFSSTVLGGTPGGWRDAGVLRSAPNWAVDGKGLLRTVWKGEPGLIVFEGILADGQRGEELTDAIATTLFQKTPDAEVSVGIVGRMSDDKNYYVVRFSGMNEIALIKVSNSEEEVLAEYVTRQRYLGGEAWKLSFELDGPRLTGRVIDADGTEQARVDGLDEDGPGSGSFGLECSNFGAVSEFTIASLQPFESKLSALQVSEANGPANLQGVVVAPAVNIQSLNTPLEDVSDDYDIIVAGAGTGGWAAAVQAARMGARVLLVEESDWIGGQMAAAGVTSMDEGGVYFKFPVRERGLYREFHQSVVNYYYTLSKDPFRAYYAWPDQLEGGYEPKVAREILYAFIAQARNNGVLDVLTGTRVTEVIKRANTVTGVVLEKDGAERSPSCGVLIEATEYGDILPLAGAPYRVGTVKSDSIEPDAPVQYHTWVAVIREYPDGLPEHLRIMSPPPGYNPNRYKKSQLHGRLIWGSPGRGYKGPRVYRVLLAWRGMADRDSVMTGIPSEQRHTQCGLNGGRQDYPVTVEGIEDLAVRRAQQAEGIYRALNEIYYLQHELGLQWSVAEDEGFNTPYQRRNMAKLNLRPDLLPIALHLPQWPYVRECRRGIGIYTLRASDLGRFDNARLFCTSVAMGDYFMDIDHGKTGDALEADLDPEKPPREGGPVQVPFEIFVPKAVDGLVFAEKNLSQSRIANGATRLQPITILTGQAAGAIAALSCRQGVQPRDVNPIAVQVALLEAGSNLIQRWYEDVSWGSPLWRATQLLSLHGVMDVPGPYVTEPDVAMGAGNYWQPGALLDEATLLTALLRLGELSGAPAQREPSIQRVTWESVGDSLTRICPDWMSAFPGGEIPSSQSVQRGDFAVVAAHVLVQTGRPLLLSDEQVAVNAR